MFNNYLFESPLCIRTLPDAGRGTGISALMELTYKSVSKTWKISGGEEGCGEKQKGSPGVGAASPSVEPDEDDGAGGYWAASGE